MNTINQEGKRENTSSTMSLPDNCRVSLYAVWPMAASIIMHIPTYIIDD